MDVRKVNAWGAVTDPFGIFIKKPKTLVIYEKRIE